MLPIQGRSPLKTMSDRIQKSPRDLKPLTPAPTPKPAAAISNKPRMPVPMKKGY